MRSCGAGCRLQPAAGQTVQPAGGVLHLAGWLADMPFIDPATMDALPGDVIAALELNLDWMRSRMPQPDSFFDLSAL